MNIKTIEAEARQVIEIVGNWAVSPQFYAQLAAIAAAVLIASFVSMLLKKRVALLRDEPQPGTLYGLRSALYAMRSLLFPLCSVLFLAIAIQAAQATVEQSWLVTIAQGLGVVVLLYTAIKRFITNPFMNALGRWVGIPIATLLVFGWLDETIQFLEGMALNVGNIKLSAYTLARVAIFGSVLFWLGRISNDAGQKAIRTRAPFDTGTREVFAKLFEIVLFVALFLVLLNIIGLPLTALAVFGGALGVGLGFGLQQIASNFISGIIILLDRSITVGDYIELEDGRTGILRELNMRSSTLETFDGKDIVVPNEQFITTTFTNWTHKDTTQRYELEFSVSYHTDLRKVPPLIIETIRKHPQVLEEPEEPDCEIREFGDSGVVFGVEYWINGIDDGKNRVDADLRMMIWEALQENKIEMPFPQREVRIVGGAVSE
ncbi:MAG: mechanosensitive ion channel family protein [Pseudomonadales bacterium]